MVNNCSIYYKFTEMLIGNLYMLFVQFYVGFINEKLFMNKGQLKTHKFLHPAKNSLFY